MIEIEINGKKVAAENGEMLIAVADREDVYIPRFCYHKKLSIAANCRMCLVEVEKAPKPMPACATPVADGMKVFTDSEYARKAQSSVMEFLLINHPLDCPICDQGGECELQDISMGFGGDISRYTQGKRVVKDKDIGALVSTDLTRCIHCTRCVRFGEEVAGFREIGLTNRGEHAEIGTYIEHSLESEVSGNIIDLCPVGALTSKPYRFTARAWELNQKPGIAAHDCLGSNVNYHVRRDDVMRVVPNDNESVNETWLSDRDRYAYEGFMSDDRLTEPMIKNNGVWEVVSWEQAFDHITSGLASIKDQQGAKRIGALASANTTTEEAYLLQKLLRALGSNNLDYRTQQQDFRDDADLQLYPGLNCGILSLENTDCALLVGANVGREQPLANLRLRKAVMQHQAKIYALNPVAYDWHFPVTDKIIVAPDLMLQQLAAIAKALGANEAEFANITVSAQAKQFADDLKQSKHGMIILGSIAEQHPKAATLRYLAKRIATLSQSEYSRLTYGANSAGCALAGLLPHRGAMGISLDNPGLNAKSMLEENLAAYLLLNLDPDVDFADSTQALQSFNKAELVVAITPYCKGAIKEYANVLLPTVPYNENEGTLVNAAGTWQSFQAAVPAHGEARPSWKILRKLANYLHFDNFTYQTVADIKQALVADYEQHFGPLPEGPAGTIPTINDALSFDGSADITSPSESKQLQCVAEMGIYNTDNVVRRAASLQKSLAYEKAGLHINASTAAQHQLTDEQKLRVQAAGAEHELAVVIDAKVADGTAHVYVNSDVPRVKFAELEWQGS